MKYLCQLYIAVAPGVKALTTNVTVSLTRIAIHPIVPIIQSAAYAANSISAQRKQSVKFFVAIVLAPEKRQEEPNGQWRRGADEHEQVPAGGRIGRFPGGTFKAGPRARRLPVIAKGQIIATFLNRCALICIDLL